MTLFQRLRSWLSELAAAIEAVEEDAQRLRSWLSELAAAIEAVEEGPYSQMDRKISALDVRLGKLEMEITDKS